ncbi:MAG TPA: uroporphyrinogen decarboxylase family protein [bacterium]|nr:uroporphyrinogen decarboxylase family protein [bacterium]
MNERKLFDDIMFYRGHDRMPVFHWGGWNETRVRWLKEGLPADAKETEFFNAVSPWAWINVVGGTEALLYPLFEQEIIEETEEYTISRATDGVVKKRWKKQSNIPQSIAFTLKTGKDWPEYKKRLLPDIKRLPSTLQKQIDDAEISESPVAIMAASLMGWIRNWMGVENFAYFMYDEPDVFSDMIDTLSTLTCWTIDQIVPRMKRKPEMVLGWEDICGRSGPFVSPNLFRKYVAPGYTKVRNKMEEYGIRLLGIDSDGDVSALTGPLLDAGVNLSYPLEIGTWNADPMEFRKKYGRELRMIGGFNKMVIEKGPSEIDAEIERRMSIMKDGGFIILPDHLITPGASLENYKYYLERIRNLRF